MADVLTLQPERGAGSVVLAETSPEPQAPRSVYLDAYLAPLRPWLDRETVTESLVNRPGEVWIEDAAHPGMQHVLLPEMDNRLLQRLAEQVARISHQGINREHPLLSATLPTYGGKSGARIQLVGPPATRANWAMAIRRHRLLELPLDAYDRGPITPPREEPAPDAMAEPIAFLRDAIRRRRTILISGGTSTGKTTFLNAMLSEIPLHERVVLVEDTAELHLPNRSTVPAAARISGPWPSGSNWKPW
ncbi:MAG: ATPase, T2SS/T4P/T4SS family [Novosphingobium sp.]